MFRYSIYCTEYGHPFTSPYDEDKSIDTAIEVCKIMGEVTKCRWYVYDTHKGMDVYLFKVDIC